VPALAIGTVYAIGALRDRVITARVGVTSRHVAIGVLAAAAILGSLVWSPLPWSRTPGYLGDRSNVFAVAARDLFDEIPGDAVVAAHYRITPHLAHRDEIYQFPVPFRVTLYGADDSLEGTRLVERAERVEYVMLPVRRDAQLRRDWAAISDAFDEVARNDLWVVYRRDWSTSL
jgi:hypothetical protein